MIKIEVYVPESHLDEVKTALLEAGAGRVGNYDYCAWQTAGDGQFRPRKGSDPFIGKQGEIEELKEIKIETVCEEKKIEDVLSALLKAHPYETPAHYYWRINSL